MWIYKNQPVENIEGEYFGFVYLITDTVTGKKYVGKKMLTMSKPDKTKTYYKTGPKKGELKPPKKGRAESKWRTYCSSSKIIQALVKTHGLQRFHREILMFCKSRSELTYQESKHIFVLGCLESDEYLNDWVSCSISKRHIYKPDTTENVGNN